MRAKVVQKRSGVGLHLALGRILESKFSTAPLVDLSRNGCPENGVECDVRDAVIASSHLLL